MKRWVFSVFSQRQVFNGQVMRVEQNHTCAVLDAISRDEAIGKAGRIASKLFPSSGDWSTNVVVSDIDNVITPEGATLAPE